MYDVYMYDFDLILIFFIFSIDVNYSKILMKNELWMKNVFRRVCILFYYVVDVFHLGICFSFFLPM